KARGQVQHGDRSGRRVRLEAATDLAAVQVGQVDVEDDQVRVFRRQAQGIQAGGRFPDLIARSLQHARQDVARSLRIVYNQDLRLRFLVHTLVTPRTPGPPPARPDAPESEPPHGNGSPWKGSRPAAPTQCLECPAPGL